MNKIVLATALAALSLNPQLSWAADFMGFTIGEPFDLPECKWDGNGYLAQYTFTSDQPVLPCWQHNMLKSKPGDPLNSSGSFQINFLPERSKSPRGIQSGTSLIVVDGKIEGVLAPTTGYKEQEYLLALLIEKYGKPKSIQSKPVQNMAGATFTKNTATWKLSGAEVSFNGIGGSVDFGFIQVVSPIADKFILDEAARIKRTAPAF